MSRTYRNGCSPYGYHNLQVVSREEWESWYNEYRRPSTTYERYASFDRRDHPSGTRGAPSWFRRMLNRQRRAQHSAVVQKWHADPLSWQYADLRGFSFGEDDLEAFWFYPEYKDIDLPRQRRDAKWRWRYT